MAEAGFHDVVFPLLANIGTIATLSRHTDVVGLANGREVRRGRWAEGRRSWSLDGGSLDAASAQVLTSFFEAREGRRFAFRFEDPLDHGTAVGANVSASDQILGVGDGDATQFALVKTYGDVVRQNLLIRPETVRVAVDGNELLTGWSVEGRGIQFASPPPVGVPLTAGFLFDVPVRFSDDQLSMTLGSQGGFARKIGLVEVRIS